MTNGSCCCSVQACIGRGSPLPQHCRSTTYVVPYATRKQVLTMLWLSLLVWQLAFPGASGLFWNELARAGESMQMPVQLLTSSAAIFFCRTRAIAHRRNRSAKVARQETTVLLVYLLDLVHVHLQCLVGAFSPCRFPRTGPKRGCNVRFRN